MRVVLDTNVLVSAFLYGGVPLEVVDLVESGIIEAATSDQALAELLDVLSRHRFSLRLRSLGLTPSAVVLRYRDAAIVVEAVATPAICADPDDDQFIGIAVAAEADLIVSGDRHLLECADSSPVPVVTPGELLTVIAALPDF